MKELDIRQWDLHDSEVVNVRIEYEIKKVIFEINLIVDEIEDKNGDYNYQYKRAVLEFMDCSHIEYRAELKDAYPNVILGFDIVELKYGRLKCEFFVGTAEKIIVECGKVSNLTILNK